jgi:excinuclease ABC subunit A
MNQDFMIFEKEDLYWELFRFKPKQLDSKSLENKFKPILENDLSFFITTPDKTFTMKFESILSCSKCDYTADKVNHYYFNPYNALGACSKCNGFGATLEYDLDKIVDRNLSVEEGGVKLLEFKRFEHLYDDFYWDLKEAKVSTTKKIKDLPQKFFNILMDGKKHFCGANELFRYLESKKYKPSTRIFIRRIQKEVTCDSCEGSRINSKSKYHKLNSKTPFYFQIWSMSISEVKAILENISLKLKEDEQELFQKMIKKINLFIDLAIDIGLGHISLARKTKTISAGEYQRLLLLKYLSYDGTDSLFVFDEPSVGLTSDEIKKVWKVLERLKKQNNTLIIVDHNPEVINKADFVVEMGPAGGADGGKVVYEGTPLNETKKKRAQVKVEKCSVPEINKKFSLSGIEIYGNKYGSFNFPYNQLIQVAGKSGSGKSSVIVNTLANGLYYDIHKENLIETAGTFKKLDSPLPFDDVIVVDSKLNKFTSRSSVGSYTELASVLRKHFASLPVSKSMGLKDGHFSANSELGQCPKCEGKGVNIIEMQYLEDIKLVCEDCNGKKLKPIYANLSDGKMTVHEAYHLPISTVVENFKLTPKFRRIVEYLKILNLDYLSLDRPLNTLSGGEKQRLYLLNKIIKKIENSLIVIENLSFGLSAQDLVRLRDLFESLLQNSNTIIIIDEHEIIEKLASYKVEF